MINILPSVLTNNPSELKKMLGRLEDVTDRVSIDIIDGKFAKNKTIDPSVFKEIDTNLKLEFQLMVVEPVKWIEKCANAGAEVIIGHIEKMKDQINFVGEVQKVGAQIGLAIDLRTPVSKLDPVILNNLDVVLVMSVPAGFGGQKFDKVVLDKIDELDEIRSRDDTPYRIQVDGGITKDNIDDVRRMGANEVSIGRRLFKGNIRDNIDKLKKAAYKI